MGYLVDSIKDRYNGLAAFNAHQYNLSYYVTSKSTARVRVDFSNCWNYERVPSGLFGPNGQFENVPIPDGAVPANGTDGEMSIYSPSSDQLWEFWKASKAPDGVWSACWGGRIDQVSKSVGVFSGGFGATATGLPLAGGMITPGEIDSGSINHAIALAVPKTADAGRLSWPAQRTDGQDPNPDAMPEGSRLRLNPKLDISRLNLSKASRAIARAAQVYGFVVTDTSGAVSVVGQAFPIAASDPWSMCLDGDPDYAVLRNFPWSELSVIEPNFGRR